MSAAFFMVDVVEPNVSNSQHPVVSMFGITLSLVEKYLLKTKWILRDVFDDTTGRVVTVATASESNETVRFAHPRISYPDQDRLCDTISLLHRLANLEGKDPAGFGKEVATVALAPLRGFNCTQCGHCCATLTDAFASYVSEEEVRMWQRLGRNDIVKWIAERPRSGGIGFLAWANPKTGKPVKKCPWLRRSDDGRYQCSIHDVQPLKCAAFPLSGAQVTGLRCGGFYKATFPLPIPRAA